jgi:membrane-associated phospholipid phosphatase
MGKLPRTLITVGLSLTFFGARPARALVKENETFIPFRPAQYYVFPALALGNLIIGLQNAPATARWKGGFFFDDAVRDALRLTTPGGRQVALTTSDILLYTLVAYPTVVDAAIDTAVVQKDTKLGAELAMINAQAFLVTGLAMVIVKKLTGRERPYQSECATDPSYDASCDVPDSRQSFFSGHSAFSFTAAGLICANHKGLDLHGGMAPCYISLGVATAVGLMRIMSDRHYASDVLVGAVVGWLSGYVMTRSLHYQALPPAMRSMETTLMPSVYPQGFGLSLAFGL